MTEIVRGQWLYRQYIQLSPIKKKSRMRPKVTHRTFKSQCSATAVLPLSPPLCCPLVATVVLTACWNLPQPGLAAQMLTAAEERPWLWVVYVLTVALPLVLVLVFCCSGKVRPPL